MPNIKQTGFNVGAGCAAALVFVIRFLTLIDSFKVINELSRYGGMKGMWILWASLILEAVAAIGFAGVVIFSFKADMDRYGLSAIAIGAGLSAEYGLILISLLSSLGIYSAQFFFNWRVILLYSAIGFFCASFIHSGITARRSEQGEPVWKKWSTATVLQVLAAVFVLIALAGSGKSLPEYLDRDTDSWKTYTIIGGDFLMLLFAGLHMKKVEENTAVYGNRQKPTVRGVPAYNANPYAPFNNPVQGSVPYPGQQPYQSYQQQPYQSYQPQQPYQPFGQGGQQPGQADTPPVQDFDQMMHSWEDMHNDKQ